MRKFLSFLSLSLTLIAVIFIILFNIFNFTPKYNITSLQKGWIVTYKNEKYLNTNLENLSAQIDTSFSKGDVITLTLNMPLRDLGCPFPYFFFKTQYCAYEFYLNNDLIESYGLDSLDTNTYLGIGYNTISLGNDYVDKKITIVLHVTENNTSVNIFSPLIGNYDDLTKYLFHSVMYPFFTGIFLLLFGQVFLIIAIVFYMRSSDILVQVISSFISMLIGIWIITAFDISDFFIDKGSATFIEYVSLFLILPSSYLLVAKLHKNMDNILLKIMGIASFAFISVFISLHFLGYVHIHHFIYPFHMLSFCGTIILYIYDYIDWKSKIKNNSTRIIMLGLTVQFTCFLLYIAFAIVHHYADYRQNPLAGIIISTGSLFFIITQLLNYFIFMTKSFAQHKEFASLSMIAYRDSLTKLQNRVSCDKKFLELDKTDIDFCIISLDLNGLKEVNDNAGHPAGDRLLSSFATALSSVFPDKSCFRIGGDEFLVVTVDISSKEIDSLLKTLELKLEELDQLDSEINHSVSYGYAFRSESEDKNSHSATMLADKRMYDFKKKYYSDMMTR